MSYLRFTQNAKIAGIKTKGFPLLFNSDGSMNQLCLNYFLDLHLHVSVNSIATYSKHLQDFYTQFELETSYDSIELLDDDYLSAYKSNLLDRGNYLNSENYASQIIRTVLHYLKWLEDNKYVRYLIGDSINYRIRIKITKDGIKHPLMKINSDKNKVLSAPRTEWIGIVKKYNSNCLRINARFELMIDWGRVAGLRSFEICALTIDQLPLRETAEKAIEDGKNIYIFLTVTKGKKKKNIPISPLLIKKTWEYIDIYREHVIKIFKARSKEKYDHFEDSNKVFLSEKTGKALLSRSFSNAVRKAFKAAVDSGELTKDERVWVHGLRHNFTVTLKKKFNENNVPRSDVVVRQATRHGSTDAMEPYLSDEFNDSFS